MSNFQALVSNLFGDRGLILLTLVFFLTIPLLTPRVAASDEIEYFSYLHSLVFDHDLNFLNEYQHYCSLDYNDCVQSRFSETFIQSKTATGLQINFGPIGSAVMWLPFYLVAHLIALGLGNADGYSAPYVYAISFASMLYGWIGIILSYKLARGYVEEKIALGAALVILFATNAVYYLYVAPAMSHANSLLASALFVFVWFRTRASRAQGNLRGWAWLGACGALMTMVREQEAIFGMIPLVETVYLAAKGIKKAGMNSPQQPTWPSQLLGLGAMVGAWIVVFIPQLLVYGALNGNYLPARDVTQKFTFDGAHIGDILFSSLHGLFSWTPVTLLAVAGLVLLWRRDKITAVAFGLTFAAEVYLLGSFSTWFGGAAFGMRRFVNCTVLFVVGLALLIDELRKRISLRILAGAGGVFIVWNLFFIVQFATGLIPRAEPIDLSRFVYDQIFTVPGRLADIAWRFIFARASFFRQQ